MGSNIGGRDGRERFARHCEVYVGLVVKLVRSMS